MTAAKRKPTGKKTAAKTAAVVETAPQMPVLIPQPNGGALLTGGVPGNKGGRPTDEWKALLARLATRAKTVGALGIILRDPHHQHFANAFKYVNSRSYPELEPVIIAAKLRASVANNPAPVGGLTINFNIVQEGQRYDPLARAEPVEIVEK